MLNSHECDIYSIRSVARDTRAKGRKLKREIGHLFRGTRARNWSLRLQAFSFRRRLRHFGALSVSHPVYPAAAARARGHTTRPGHPSNIIVSRIPTARVALLIALLELLRGVVS